ncbi:uncharacterized protein LOC130436558 [Triplophysa dalaica]|uniref:uncharacterized protein LOC130436558 n=1 Tax=Triplophysa dalaica TaxID=1582913 RepID=UPI0024DFA357|nr:uncharacterized protein LOC130436558 [Triplophysa dalaica]XP_056623295.1 uncharacterized protein LOC130436558 [Triplophysa dalaica]
MMSPCRQNRQPQGPQAWLAGCVGPMEPPRDAPKRTVRLDGRRVTAVLDSSSKFFGPAKGEDGYPHYLCSRDTRSVPARRVTITAGSWPLEVGIIQDLPVPVLLGRDWPGFERLLTQAVQPVSTQRRSQRRPVITKGPPRRIAMLATESEREGESENRVNNLFSDLYHQVNIGGSFGREQREDDRLRHSWSQVRMVDGEVRQNPPHPLPYFTVQSGLLYCVAQRRGEEKQLLVVPKSKVNPILELAHTHPFSGTLRIGQYRSAHQGPISLARLRRRYEAVLPKLPHLSGNFASKPPPVRLFLCP